MKNCSCFSTESHCKVVFFIKTQSRKQPRLEGGRGGHLVQSPAQSRTYSEGRSKVGLPLSFLHPEAERYSAFPCLCPSDFLALSLERQSLGGWSTEIGITNGKGGGIRQDGRCCQPLQSWGPPPLSPGTSELAPGPALELCWGTSPRSNRW